MGSCIILFFNYQNVSDFGSNSMKHSPTLLEIKFLKTMPVLFQLKNQGTPSFYIPCMCGSDRSILECRLHLLRPWESIPMDNQRGEHPLYLSLTCCHEVLVTMDIGHTVSPCRCVSDSALRSSDLAAFSCLHSRSII